MTGNRATIERYDLAIDRLLRFHPQAVDLAVELAGEEALPLDSIDRLQAGSRSVVLPETWIDHAAGDRLRAEIEIDSHRAVSA